MIGGDGGTNAFEFKPQAVPHTHTATFLLIVRHCCKKRSRKSCLMSIKMISSTLSLIIDDQFCQPTPFPCEDSINGPCFRMTRVIKVKRQLFSMLGVKPLIECATQCRLPVGKPFCIAPRGWTWRDSFAIKARYYLFCFRVWAECFTNGPDADISCSKPVNISCIQSWGMRLKGGIAEKLPDWGLSIRPTNHRPTAQTEI